MSGGVLQILKPGLLTTVQDLGRWGSQGVGVPVGGPMDSFSHRLANLLVANDPHAATLEITLIGPDIAVEADTTMAVAGAQFEIRCDDVAVACDTSFVVRRGQRLRFGRRIRGARAYLAVAGGIATIPILGSRATQLVTHMGGLGGRALVADDCLPVADHAGDGKPRQASGLVLTGSGRTRLRVMAGHQRAWFTEEAWQTFTRSAFRVSPKSNRMGYRLDGARLARRDAQEPISEPVVMGAIQVPAAGEPILLMADRQTAGGYPKIASVIGADLPVAGQLAPGDVVEFVECSRQDAVAALIARERHLMRYAA